MSLKKRYQVFISSTYSDLRSHRDAISNAIQEMGHIPAGMELFGSDADDSWTVIKRTIDSSDYFVLVLAGRYGTLSDSGLGFTEREFDYACATGVPILAFLHESPSNLPACEVESLPKRRRHLEAFRDKVRSGNQVSFWKDKDDLCVKVVASLSKVFENKPRPGWVRGDIEAELENLLRPALRASLLPPSLARDSRGIRVDRSENLAAQVGVKQEKRHLQARINAGYRDSGTAMPEIATGAPFLGLTGQSFPPIPIDIIHQAVKVEKIGEKYTRTPIGRPFTYRSEIDIRSLGAWLYAMKHRILSPHIFAHVVLQSAISAAAARGYAIHRDRDGSHHMHYSAEYKIDTGSLAEIATAAIAGGLIDIDNPTTDAFTNYESQKPYGDIEPGFLGEINDTCWQNCAYYFGTYPAPFRPRIKHHGYRPWQNWEDEQKRKRDKRLT